MRYLLDTCVISDFIRGDKNTVTTLQNTPPSFIAISTITVFELEFGLARNPAKAKKIRKLVDDVLKSVTIVGFNQDVAASAAKLRSQLYRKGTPIGAYDVLIAGVALVHDFVLVTANEKEFIRIPSLVVKNWR